MLGRNGASELHPPDHISGTHVLHLSLLILRGVGPPLGLAGWYPGKVTGRRKARGRSGEPRKGFKWVAGHARSLWSEGMELGKVRTGAALSQWRWGT